MKRKNLALVGLATILLAGCASQGATETGAENDSRTPSSNIEILSPLRGEGNDLVSHVSPQARAADVPVVLTGTVAGVKAGRTLVPTLGDTDFEIHEETAVVRIKIDRVFKADGVKLDPDQAFVSMGRGSQMTDTSGEPVGDGPTTITSIEVFNKALPVGTRVLVLANQANTPAEGDGAVLNEEAGAGPGETLLMGTAEQSFAVEDNTTGLLSGWESVRYDEAVAAIEKLLTRG